MKAHLHVHDGDAHLELIADTPFEKKTLAMCKENFPIQSLHIQINRRDGYGDYNGEVQTAQVIIHFEPQIEAPPDIQNIHVP